MVWTRQILQKVQSLVPSQASEEGLYIDHENYVENTESPEQELPFIEHLDLSPAPVVVIDTMKELTIALDRLPSDQQLMCLSEMFSKLAESHAGLSIPNNYLEVSLKVMKRLKESKHVNLQYELAKGLGIMRPDGSDAIFPTERIPMGLLQYMVLFFNSGAGQQINCVHAVEPHKETSLNGGHLQYDERL